MNTSYTIAGKCEPDIDSVEKLHNEGFENFELYLNTDILDNNTVNSIVSTCKSAPGSFVNVHTPHININEPNCKSYFKQTDEIANKLDSTFVFDSNPTSTRYAPTLYPTNDIQSSSYGYENDPSISSYYLELTHLSQGLPLVLDTAHLHMSEPEYLPFIEKLLENYQSLIPAIHLADGIRTKDGLPFGEGSVPLKRIINLLETHDYSGNVVLETSQKTQPEALQFVKETIQK